MKLFNKIKKIVEPTKSTLQRVKPVFYTVDGNKHYGITYKWVKASGLLCSVGEYVMIDIKSDGYIYDENKVMYPITNVLSIEWNVVQEKTVIGEFPYRIYFLNSEVEKMTVCK